MNQLKEILTLNVVNAAGETIFTERISSENYTRKFDFRYLAKGIYMIQVDAGKKSFGEKIVIQ